MLNLLKHANITCNWITDRTRSIMSASTPKSANFHLREVMMLVLAALAIFLLIALFSYSASDPGWSFKAVEVIQNKGGRFGAWSAFSLFALFGFFAYLIPLLILYGIGISYVDHKQEDSHGGAVLVLRWLGAALIFAAGSGLASILFDVYSMSLPYGSGGLLGSFIGRDLMPYFNYAGTVLALIAILFIGLTLFSGVSWLKFFVMILHKVSCGLLWIVRGG